MQSGHGHAEVFKKVWNPILGVRAHVYTAHIAQPRPWTLLVTLQKNLLLKEKGQLLHYFRDAHWSAQLA